MDKKFSVLMSLYIKEKPEYLRECMESILKQTISPDEIVIVKDGPLTEELEQVLNEYICKNPLLYTIVPLEKNVGLGLALAEGMHDVTHIVACRKVPLSDTEIKKYQKKRDGFNHVTVMFKKSKVLEAGNYQSCMLMEDSLLWVNMILMGITSMNIDDSLVFVRIGKDMYERRGGLSYFKKYYMGRKKIRETGYISLWDYYSTLLVQLIVALIPNKLRGVIFKKVLHR